MSDRTTVKIVMHKDNLDETQLLELATYEETCSNDQVCVVIDDVDPNSYELIEDLLELKIPYLKLVQGTQYIEHTLQVGQRDKYGTYSVLTYSLSSSLVGIEDVLHAFQQRFEPNQSIQLLNAEIIDTTYDISLGEFNDNVAADPQTDSALCDENDTLLTNVGFELDDFAIGVQLSMKSITDTPFVDKVKLDSVEATHAVFSDKTSQAASDKHLCRKYLFSQRVHIGDSIEFSFALDIVFDETSMQASRGIDAPVCFMTRGVMCSCKDSAVNAGLQRMFRTFYYECMSMLISREMRNVAHQSMQYDIEKVALGSLFEFPEAIQNEVSEFIEESFESLGLKQMLSPLQYRQCFKAIKFTPKELMLQDGKDMPIIFELSYRSVKAALMEMVADNSLQRFEMLSVLHRLEGVVHALTISIPIFELTKQIALSAQRTAEVFESDIAYNCYLTDLMVEVVEAICAKPHDIYVCDKGLLSHNKKSYRVKQNC